MADIKVGDFVKIKPGILDGVGEWMKGFGVNYSDIYELQQNATGLFFKSRNGTTVYTHPPMLILATPEPQVRNVNVYSHIILTEAVTGLRVGDTYEVEAVNISGSYMVKHPRYHNKIPVALSKFRPAHNSITKSVPCRCSEFCGIQEIPNQTPMENPMKLTQPSRPQPFEIKEAPSSVMKQIKKQKAVALEALTFCKIMDYRAFIAGGAPRNWYLNSPANDIDIFLRIPNNASPEHMMHILEAFGVTDVFNLSTHKAPGVKRDSYSSETRKLYASDSAQRIEYVLEGKYQGENVQFIFLQSSASTLNAYTVRYFDSSINMIIADWEKGGEGLVIQPHQVFNDTINTGAIFVFKNGNAYGDGKHLDKIHSYFPEAPLVSHRVMKQVISNPELAYKYAKDWEDLAANPDDISEEDDFIAF